MWVALLLGLFSSLHCAGMCGGVIAAATLRIETHRVPMVVLINVARVASYAIAGALAAGGLGALTGTLGTTGHQVLSLIAAAIVAAAGLQLGGWMNFWAGLERLGGRVWQHLSRATRVLLPVRRAWQAALFGLMWGWMPCGLVYSALGYAAATGSWRDGAMYMFAFGAGTLPAMTGLGLFSNLSSRLQRHHRWRQAAGAALILIAAITLVIHFAPQSHDHGQASPATPSGASDHAIHQGHQ